MSDDQELNDLRSLVAEPWAIDCAIRIEAEYGNRAAAFIGEMFFKMAAQADEMGMAHYMAIARAYDQLTSKPTNLNLTFWTRRPVHWTLKLKSSTGLLINKAPRSLPKSDIPGGCQ